MNCYICGHTLQEIKLSKDLKIEECHVCKEVILETIYDEQYLEMFEVPDFDVPYEEAFEW